MAKYWFVQELKTEIKYFFIYVLLQLEYFVILPNIHKFHSQSCKGARVSTQICIVLVPLID